MQEQTGGFKNLGELLPFKVAYEVIRRFPCEACGSERVEAKGIEPFGPKKGQAFQRVEPCQRCEDLALFRKQQEQAREEARKRKSARALALFDEKSLINTKLKDSTFANYIPTIPPLASAKEQAMNWAAEFDRENPRNLILFGNYGTGKSHLAVSIAKELMDSGVACIFVTVQKLLTLIKQTYDRGSNASEGDLLTALEDVAVLILDDIGAEQLTEWGTPKLFEILDTRQGKCTIYTTNHNEQELIEKLGPRNVSRMYFDADEIELNGPDYRRRKHGES